MTKVTGPTREQALQHKLNRAVRDLNMYRSHATSGWALAIVGWGLFLADRLGAL